MRAIPTKIAIYYENGEIAIHYVPSRNIANDFAKQWFKNQHFGDEMKLQPMTDSEIIANHTALNQFKQQRKNARLRKKYPKAFEMVL